jgi:hypothetical protein
MKAERMWLLMLQYWRLLDAKALSTDACTWCGTQGWLWN